MIFAIHQYELTTGVNLSRYHPKLPAHLPSNSLNISFALYITKKSSTSLWLRDQRQNAHYVFCRFQLPPQHA